MSWQLGHGDFDGPFSLKEIRDEDLKLVWAKLQLLEGMSLDTLIAKGNHPTDIEKITEKAQNRLVELKLDDVELWSFPITQRKRLWCIKSGDVFELLWFDPKHEVFPSKYKAQHSVIRRNS